MVRHDAKWSPGIRERAAEILNQFDPCLLIDPQAGRDPDFPSFFPQHECFGIEIEPEWAKAAGPWVRQGDALHRLAYPLRTSDSLRPPCRFFTSVTYGNRFSGNYLGSRCRTCGGSGWGSQPAVDDEGRPCEFCKGTGTDERGRSGYAIALGRQLTEGNTAAHGFGKDYRVKYTRMALIWSELCLPGTEGALLLNIKDHYKSERITVPASQSKTGKPVKVSVQRLVRVSDWWEEMLTGLGFARRDRIRIPAAGNRRGENGDARTTAELLYVFDYMG